MELTNQTTLRGYLAHLQSLVRKSTMLQGAAALHPDDTLERAAARALNPALAEEWNKLRVDVKKVLGVQLVEYSELPLARFPTGNRDEGFRGGMRDLLRIRLGVLKKKADKARIKDPSITLLRSWNPREQEPKDE